MNERQTLGVEKFIVDDPDEAICADCGEEVDDGARVCWEPLSPGSKEQVLAHDYCAVRNGYSLKEVAK